VKKLMRAATAGERRRHPGENMAGENHGG